MDGSMKGDLQQYPQRKRTNTGCITCRIRRVKCDETRPSCKRCIQAKRFCEGYLPTSFKATKSHVGSRDLSRPPITGAGSRPLSRRALVVAMRQVNAIGPVSRVLAPWTYLQDDVACFDYFRLRLTASTSETRHCLRDVSSFWNYTLLQVAHLDPAVWNAVAALGALYRGWEVVSGSNKDSLSVTGYCAMGVDSVEAGIDPSLLSTRLMNQAETCYTASLNLGKAIREPRTMLILSISLAASANMLGRWEDSSVHGGAAQHLMSNLRNGYDTMTDVDSHAAEALAGLELQWLSFSEQRAPTPMRIDSPAVTFDVLKCHPFGTEQESRITIIRRANTVLVGIMGRILAGADAESLHQLYVDMPPDPIRSQMPPTIAETAIRMELDTWENNLAELLMVTSTRASGDSLDLLFIKIGHATCRLLLEAGCMRPDHSELSWDRCLAHFERATAVAAMILRKEAQNNALLPAIMSLEQFPINMILWLTAHRCRHPVLRRRAVQLLQSARRLEGRWMSTSTAVAAEKIIEVEEGGNPASITWEKPPYQQWAAREESLIQKIETEKASSSSWLGPNAYWTRTGSSLELAAREVNVPLQRRVTQIDVKVDYDPRVGKSRGDLTLLFADRDSNGSLRSEMASVYF